MNTETEELAGSAVDTSTDTLTRRFCGTLAARRVEDMPDKVMREGCRGVLDWLGCAIAGSAHRTLDILLATLREIAPSPMATVLGRDLKLGLLEAAIANGQAGHVLDYDDTHQAGTTVIHASSPIMAALFGLAERRRVSGRSLLLAYATGFDAGVRVGWTAQGHIDKGFHGTGTLGTFCAAAAAARLLDLDERKFTHALAIAGTQAAGMQQNRGTMCKSFHAGKAASNGILAAMLADGGFTSSLEIVEGELGFCRLYSDISAPEALRQEPGDWEILTNGHKPYACGFVLHPTIDAVIEIRRRVPLKPEEIERIDVRGHKHVESVTFVVDPPTGLQAKFSTRHSAAVALIDGAAGMAQYTDARATDPVVRSLRRRVNVAIDPSFTKGEAVVKITTVGGAVHEHYVKHASGTTQNPMTDQALEAKFMANAVPVIGTERANAAKDLVWRLPELDDVTQIHRACA